MSYVDGFLLVVPKKNLEVYKKMAEMGRDVWMKHGALDYKECVGDDLKVSEMGDQKTRTFTDAAEARSDEVIIFSFIVFKSKAHRDQVNKKVMKDPLMNDPSYQNQPMPFDMSRMAYGGFQTIVESPPKK